MDIAVILSHLDDEVLSCGGTIARYNIEGHNIHVLVLTDSCSAGHRGIAEIITDKIDEFEAAMEILGGYKSWKICEFPDMRLDTVPHVDLNRAIENFIDQVQPEMVFTHHPGDINLDHRITYQSVLVSTRPVPGCPVKKILCCESIYNIEWFGQPFVPTIYVDINSTLQKKLSAMNKYKSELREYPHPRSILNIEHIARVRGAAAGLEVAEAFQLVRSIE